MAVEKSAATTAQSSLAQAGLNIDLVVLDDQWPAGLVEPAMFEKIASAINREVEFSEECEAAVSLSCDRHLQTLNDNYRGKNAPTNVLSFPSGPKTMAHRESCDTVDEAYSDAAAGRNGGLGNDVRFLGDVILARETLVCEARGLNVELSHHLAHLVVHGILHLLGYDHEDSDDAHAMEALEVKILKHLDIVNPYADQPNEGEVVSTG